MDAVLAGILAVPFDLAVEIWNREGLGKFDTAVAFDPRDDVVGRGFHICTAGMVIELELLAMRRDCRHDGFRCFLAALERRGSQNATYDHARIHMPGL